jgi:hypothetical protein
MTPQIGEPSLEGGIELLQEHMSQSEPVLAGAHTPTERIAPVVWKSFPGWCKITTIVERLGKASDAAPFPVHREIHARVDHRIAKRTPAGRKQMLCGVGEATYLSVGGPANWRDWPAAPARLKGSVSIWPKLACRPRVLLVGQNEL